MHAFTRDYRSRPALKVYFDYDIVSMTPLKKREFCKRTNLCCEFLDIVQTGANNPFHSLLI